MKKLFTLLFTITLLLTSYTSNAQCAVFEQLPVTQPGIFPLPAGVIPADFGGVGINQTAKVGEFFSHSWTVALPRDYADPVTMNPAISDSIGILVDSIFVTHNGVTTVGLPEGLSINCSTGNCWFQPDNDKPAGCWGIEGTPSANVEPGDYFIVFKLGQCLKIPAISYDQCFEISVPGATSGILGEYKLTIEAADQPACEIFEQLPVDQPSIFPLPAGVIPADFGGIGINQEATIGEFFSYNWTVALPRDYSDPVTMNPAISDSIGVLEDSIFVTYNGVTTVGLPEGLELVCSTGNCWFQPDNEKPAGCFGIQGTPSANLAPGDYTIVFKLGQCLKIPNINYDQCFEISVPGATSGILGEYKLTINAPAAASCAVFEQLPVDQPGIFPLPAGVIPADFGGIGINKTAKIGEFFSYDWTVALPRDYTDPVTMNPAISDSIGVLEDSIFVTYNGVTTTGLPEGLELVCSTGNCWFQPDNEKPAGCFGIQGTPSANLAPGDYTIVFKLGQCLKIPNISYDQCFEISLPGATSGILGEYKLTIEGTTSTQNLLAQKMSLKNSPNPFSDNTQFEINSTIKGGFDLQIHDVAGRLVHGESVELIEGKNTIPFEKGDMAKGLYFYSISSELGRLTGKMMVH